MVASSEKLVPAPMSVPRPTWTGRRGSRASRRRNSPLPRNRFEVGQCASAVPVAWQRSNSDSSEMHAVGQHRAPADQAVVVVDVEIVAPLREELPHPGDLVEGLRDVGLHEHLGMLAPERARQLELLGRARSCKARRDRVERAAAAVPLADQRLRLVVAAIGRYRAAPPARCGPSAPCRR